MKSFFINVSLLFLFLSIPFISSAKRLSIDSLYKVLKTEREDTNKAKTLASLCTSLYFSNNSNNNIDSLCLITLDLANKIHFNYAIIKANWCLGSVYIEEGKDSNSLACFNKSLQIATVNNDTYWEATSLNCIGLAYYNLSNFTKALDYYNKALEAWRAQKNKHYPVEEAIVLNNIGIVYQEVGNYVTAEKYFVEALKIRENTGDIEAQASSLNNIGTLYKVQNNFDKALEYCLQSLSLRQKINEDFGSANSMGNIAEIYSSLHKYSEALSYYNKALAIFQKEQDKSLVALTYLNIGVTYDKKEMYKEAISYLEKAVQLGQEIKDKELTAEIMLSFGDVYINQKQYSLALGFEEKSILLAKEIGTQDQIMRSAQKLSDIYENTGDKAKALDYYKTYVQIKDSLFNKENNKKLVESEMNYEFDKKQAVEKAEQDKKDALHDEQVKKQKITIYSILLGFILLLILAITIYKSLRQSKKATRVITEQKEVIEEKNKNIIDSITYAKVIQQAILPSEKILKEHLPESFVLYRPKDIVSGDFYWFSHLNDKLIIAAIDCTGHGVPGAFMSMIGNTLMNEIVNEKHITKPSEILKYLNKGVYISLHQGKQDVQSYDGMDMSLCVIDRKNKRLEYAGAKNPLYIVKNGTSIEVIKGDMYNIGGGLTTKKTEPLDRVYNNHTITIEANTTIYLFSDGYMDQFGDDGRKFGSEQFKTLLLSNSQLSMKDQRRSIDKAFEKWKASQQQIDDVLVIGIRLTGEALTTV